MSQKLKGEGRVISVLSDGLGSGIKACVLSTMTATMAMNFTAMNESILRTSTSIMNTYGCNVFFLKTHTHYVLYLLFSDVISQETAEYQASEAAKKIWHIFNHNNISTYIGVSLYSSDLQQIS